MKTCLRSEQGIGVAAVIMAVAMMLALGLAGLAFADAEQKNSGTDRVKESSFNLGEGALSAQSYMLSTNWPGTAGNQFPVCDLSDGTAAANPDYCPSPTKLSESFNNKDYAANIDWNTSVRDDPTGSYYDATQVPSAARWDSNKNGQVWLRAQAYVRGERRTLVALVQIEQAAESLPGRVVIAGKVATSNNGNKTIIATRAGADVTVRCDSTSTPPNACLNFEANKGQVSPNGAWKDQEFVGQSAIPAASAARLEKRAKADGTWYAAGTCPTNAQLTGAVVYIKNANCGPYSGFTANSANSPGVVIVETGTLAFHSNFTFYGVVYAMNKQNSSGEVFKIHANGTLRGAVYVDGAGQVTAGSDKDNIIYDDFSVMNIKSYGTAGVVQNTWREVPGG